MSNSCQRAAPDTRQSPPRRPHVRLNSNPEDLLANDNFDHPPRHSSGRRHKEETQLVPSPSLSSDSLRRNNVSNASSRERLLPPKPKPRSRKNRNITVPTSFTADSGFARFRSDSDSSAASDSPYGPATSPFADSQALSSFDRRHGPLNTQTVADKYRFTPLADLMLFPDEVEADDWLHSPTPGEKDARSCDCSGQGLLNLCGLAFLVIGIFFLFIGYPLMTYIQNITQSRISTCAADPDCIADDLPILRNVRIGLVDPSTPQYALKRKKEDGSYQNLVFSDEFNRPGRTFYENDDAYFQAVDLWYGVTEDLEWYDPDAITTSNGTLNIRLDAFRNHDLNYRSGMLQSWNQMCFKGGYLEASISLPGDGKTSGFWPGFWAMGNLGRPGYAATTEGMWPYSYWDKCDWGITVNQSQTDGISYLPGMKLPACVCSKDKQYHPSPGKSRSAPEMDAIEASVGPLGSGGEHVGTASQSVQFAPFDIWYLPNYEFAEIYNSSITSVNSYRGSSYQQAISAVTNLNNNWYDGNEYQKYGLEYKPGAEGHVVWYVGDDRTWKLDGRSIGPNGNVGQRIVPEEPMALVVNFGISENFALVDIAGIGKLLPSTMRVDYIRIYQDGDGIVTCDPPGYPTTEYINAHPKAYRDTERLTWEQTGYQWPTNSFVDGCQA